MDIKSIMDQHVFSGNVDSENRNGGPFGDGKECGGPLMAAYLADVQRYQEENDEDYVVGEPEDDDGDYAEFVDKDYREDIKGLIGNKEGQKQSGGVEENQDGQGNAEGSKSTEKKRKLVHGGDGNVVADTSPSSSFSPPPMKKRRTDGDAMCKQ